MGLFFYFSVQINFVHDILPVPEIKYYWIVIIVSDENIFVGFFILTVFLKEIVGLGGPVSGGRGLLTCMYPT